VRLKRPSRISAYSIFSVARRQTSWNFVSHTKRDNAVTMPVAKTACPRDGEVFRIVSEDDVFERVGLTLQKLLETVVSTDQFPTNSSKNTG